MQWTSALAIYLLMWVFSAFFVLPFHGRRAGDEDEVFVQGQEPGAPVRFRPLRIMIQMTVVTAAIFLLFYLAYLQGWVDPDVIAGRA